MTRRDFETGPKTLIDAVKGIRGPRGVALEECNMADWAYRTLLPYADEIIVCDPRRNRLDHPPHRGYIVCVHLSGPPKTAAVESMLMRKG